MSEHGFGVSDGDQTRGWWSGDDCNKDDMILVE